MTERYADSKRRMNEHAKSLALVDFSHAVHVVHQDGTTFLFYHAIMVDDLADDGFVWVFTEHNGYFIFHKDDLDTCRQFENGTYS